MAIICGFKTLLGLTQNCPGKAAQRRWGDGLNQQR